MSTGYTISVGYNSSFKKDEVGWELEKIVKSICIDPEQLIQEAKRVEGKTIPPEYVESYHIPWKDLAIQIVIQDGLPVVIQLASGGGDSRDLKEAVRRAFCRLVLAHMHSQGMEVNLTVS